MGQLLKNPNAKTVNLETILVINNPYSTVSTKDLVEAKSVFKPKEIQVAFIADGSMCPFLHTTVDNEGNATDLIGKPIPNCEIKIINSSGKILPTGQPGKLLTKGPHTMKEYTGDNSREIIDPEGWLDTGVEAMLNEDGNLYLTKKPPKPTVCDEIRHLKEIGDVPQDFPENFSWTKEEFNEIMKEGEKVYSPEKVKKFLDELT